MRGMFQKKNSLQYGDRQIIGAHPGFTIGSRNGVTGDNSNIQDVAVYTRALSQSEIQDHTGLLLQYRDRQIIKILLAVRVDCDSLGACVVLDG